MPSSASALREVQQEVLGKSMAGQHVGSPGSRRARRDAAGLSDMMPRSQGWDEDPAQEVPACCTVQDRIGQVAFKTNVPLFSSKHPCMRDWVFGEASLTCGNSACLIWAYRGCICVDIVSCLPLRATSLHQMNPALPHVSPEQSCPLIFHGQHKDVSPAPPEPFLRPFLWPSHVPLQLGEAEGQRNKDGHGNGCYWWSCPGDLQA